MIIVSLFPLLILSYDIYFSDARIGKRTECRIKEGQLSPSELQSLAQETISKWKIVERVLGLHDWQLEQIEHDYRGDVYEQSYQTLKQWT